MPRKRDRPDRPAAILLVDDDENLLDLLGQLLVLEGYTPLKASSGTAAERLGLEHGSDLELAILDLHMPGVNARELLDHLRAGHPLLKILLLTGYNPQVAQARSGIPESHILCKPFDTTVLLDKIQEALDS